MNHSFFIFLDKPVGISSQQCLHRFKKKFSIKKAGHHGTLDPFATGLLLVGVNEATKFFQFIDDSQKTYAAEIRLGIQTNTLDHTGEVVATAAVGNYAVQEIRSQVATLEGRMGQVPPMFSAKKIDGKKLYELAREGVEVERNAVEVDIHGIEVVSWENPVLKIVVTCSRGTYVRVLAEQIAALLGTVGHLSSLRRTVLCGHDLSFACSLENETLPTEKMISVEQLLKGYERLDLNDKQLADLYFGRVIQDTVAHNKKVLAFHQGGFIGVLQGDDQGLRSVRLVVR